MDFALTDPQQTVQDLARRLLTDACTPERLRAAERSDSPGLDRALWATLAEAGLLGTAVAEEHGGLGLGLLEVALLLEEAGRAAAPVPLLPVLVAALAVSRHGTGQQQAHVLPGVTAGTHLVSPALVEALGEEDQPGTTAEPDGTAWRLTGTKVCVPAGTVADSLIVSAHSPDGPRLFFVSPTDPGVTLEPQETMSYVPEALLVLDGAEGWPLGGADALADVLQIATVATCAVLSGMAQQAVQLTAAYTMAREQFGHPIAHFQAVGQRAADAFIDTRTMRLTMLQAVWLVAEQQPAAKQVAVAKYFASDAGQRVVRAAAHLHGGMGVSREYPLHRYYLGVKQLELTLGGGTRQLLALGRLLAAEPV